MNEMKLLELFSKNLRTMLEYDNMKQDELAKEIGVSQAMISRYITGQSMPSFFTVVKISEVLFCSLDDFLNEKLN